MPTEEMCTVLLVDFSEEVFPLLSRYDPVTSPAEAAHVVPESPHLQVSFEEARQSALAWVASEEGERLAFYSAAEGAEPSPVPGGPMEAAAPKRKTAPRAKRPTNAQLSEQLGALVELIPSLTQQVQELATRQTALEKRAAPVAAPPLPAHRLAFPQPNAAPVPETPLRTLGSLVGPSSSSKGCHSRSASARRPRAAGRGDQVGSSVGGAIGASRRFELRFGKGHAAAKPSPRYPSLSPSFPSRCLRPRLSFFRGYRVGFAGFGQEREAAGAACKSQWELSSAGESAGLAEAVTFRAAAHEPGRSGAEAPRVYLLRRALRRVWQPKKFGDSFLAARQHSRFYDSGRPGRSRGAHGPSLGSSGAMCSRWRVLGDWVLTDSFGGPSPPAFPAPPSIPKPAPPSVRRTHSADLGDNHPLLCEGDRCNPDEAHRGSWRLQGETFFSGCSRLRGCSKASPSEVPEKSEGTGGVTSDLPLPSVGASAFRAPPGLAPPGVQGVGSLEFRGQGCHCLPQPPAPEKHQASASGLSRSPHPLSCAGAFDPFVGHRVSRRARGREAGCRPHSSCNSSSGELGGPSSASCPPAPASVLHASPRSFEKPGADLPRRLSDEPRPLCFRAFGLSLASRVVRTRGSFGAFLNSTLHLSQDKPPRPAHALFPLPVPFPGCFQHIPSAKASRVRTRVAVRRVAHVAVMACNFLFAGTSPVELPLLCHRPNKAQAHAISYVHRLCRACGAVEPFHVGSAGRRNQSLVASLSELSECLTVVGPSADPYGPSFHGTAPRAAGATHGSTES